MARLTINGKSMEVTVDPSTPLLWAIREQVGLTETKYGCGIAQCGSCTVHLDGMAVRSCVVPVAAAEGKQVTTIEGLAPQGALHPLQQAFIDHDAFQCGYCTPGQICSAVAVLDEIRAGLPSHVTADLMAEPPLSADEVRERMSGNICRCGAYSNIVESIAEVAGGFA